MDDLQLIHNSHLSSIVDFSKTDPNLRKMSNQKIQHRPSLLDKLPKKDAGIYILTGGRQVGKTTTLKLWMKELLQDDWSANNIIFLTGEIINTHHQLISTINDVIKENFNSELSILILDEVTYIKDWDKGIKFLADLGTFQNIILILTSSDQKILKSASKTFPGRRGNALEDLRLLPLSFKETLIAKKIITKDSNKIELTDSELEKCFNDYLHHGGYLLAINDWENFGKITPQTYKIYSDWIFGDFLKHNKSETFLKEILSALIKRYGTAISFNNIAKDISIDHPATVSSYIELLTDLEALFILSALDENKLVAYPKKPKKFFFLDPFIYQSMSHFINATPLDMTKLENREALSMIVESIVASHYYREYPTYYIKAEREVDIAYLKNKTFFPIEVKWTSQIRPEDLKQVLKYKNSIIYCKNHGESKINQTEVKFLPRELVNLST